MGIEEEGLFFLNGTVFFIFWLSTRCVCAPQSIVTPNSLLVAQDCKVWLLSGGPCQFSSAQSGSCVWCCQSKKET